MRTQAWPWLLVRTGIVLTLALLGAFPAAAAPSHTVRPGETLSEIAEAYNLSLETLASVNAIADVNRIAAGTPLLVPDSCAAVGPACAAASATAATYRVQTGDTLEDIAAALGTSLDRLLAANPAIADADRIRAGHVLTIPRLTEDEAAAPEPERWIAVDLTSQRMHAMVGDQPVHTAVISSGMRDWETPTGTFHILRRVANETMTSASIGAEGYYYRENVLYTQYFTDAGHALHYSWWQESGSFGRPTSHGCVGQTLQDAKYFWDFARVGTRVAITGQPPPN